VSFNGKLPNRKSVYPGNGLISQNVNTCYPYDSRVAR